MELGGRGEGELPPPPQRQSDEDDDDVSADCIVLIRTAPLSKNKVTF